MMTRFLSRIIILFLIVFAVDRLLGYTLGIAYNHKKVDYICNNCDQDILVFGSSRAEFHYNTRMIEDSLGISSFNCGASGFGIINSLGYLQMILRHHHPKIVIYDVELHFDLEKMDNHRFLLHLKPYYYHKSIKKLILRVDLLEKYKMLSLLYRFNSNYIHRPNRIFATEYDNNVIENNGFVPQQKAFKRPTSAVIEMEDKPFLIDTLKVNMLKDFVQSLGDSTRIIAVISPTWQGSEGIGKEYIKLLLEQFDIPLYDFSNSPKYIMHDNLFYDNSHLNAEGANVFSQDVIEIIKQEYLQHHQGGGHGPKRQRF